MSRTPQLVRSLLLVVAFGLAVSAACSKVSHNARILVARPDVVGDTSPPVDLVTPDLRDGAGFDLAHDTVVRPDAVEDLSPDTIEPPDLNPVDLVVVDSVEDIRPDLDLVDVKDVADSVDADVRDLDQPDLADGADTADVGPISCNSNFQCSALTGPCSVGVCVNGACLRQTLGNGVPCNDGLFCTIGKRCQQGQCIGVQRNCPNPPGDPCRRGVCSESEKKCTVAPRPDGASCTGDPYPCTSQVCANGSCVLDSIKGCLIQGACYPPGGSTSSNQCLGCNPDVSQFNFSPLPEGSPCVTPDGRPGSCQNGACSQWSRITFAPAEFHSIDHRGPSKGVWIVGQSGQTGLIWRFENGKIEPIYKSASVVFRSVSFDVAVGEQLFGNGEPSIVMYAGANWNFAPDGFGSALKQSWRAVIGGDSGNVRNFLFTGDYDKIVHCFCLLNFGCLNYSCTDKDVLIAPNSFAVAFDGRYLHATLGDTNSEVSIFAIGSDVDQGNTFQDVAWFSTPDDAFLLSGKSQTFTGILNGQLLTAFGDRSSNLWVAGTNSLLLSRLGTGDQASWKTYSPAEIGLTANANLTAGYADGQGISIFGDRPRPNGGRELVFIRGQRGPDGSIKWIPPLVFAQTPTGISDAKAQQLKARDIDYIEGTGFVVVGHEPSPTNDFPTGVIWIFSN